MDIDINSIVEELESTLSKNPTSNVNYGLPLTVSQRIDVCLVKSLLNIARSLRLIEQHLRSLR